MCKQLVKTVICFGKELAFSYLKPKGCLDCVADPNYVCNTTKAECIGMKKPMHDPCKHRIVHIIIMSFTTFFFFQKQELSNVTQI